jgi:hypothetical protein
MLILDRRWRMAAGAAMSVVLTLVAILTVAGGASAGAHPLPRADLPKALTPNPTEGSSGSLHGYVYAWSNGLTVKFTGDVGGFTGQLAFYAPAGGGPAVVDPIDCQGPDYSVFIGLSPGEWAGYVTLLTGESANFPAFTFDLKVGAPGSKPAPPVSCQTPPPFAGFVDGSVIDGAATPSGKGYWMVGSDGSVQGFGDAAWFGDTSGQSLNGPIVGIAASPDGDGYWLVGQDGGVFNFGDAQYYGSAGGMALNQPVVGMAATPDGKGYWLVAADGGIFGFGDARFYGSTGGKVLNQPVVGMASTPSGHGYFLDASDGGIFAFGDARFNGSMGGTPLNQPVVGMSVDPSTGGYWEVAADGGIFAFDAPFLGSAGNLQLAGPVVGVTTTPSGKGYRLYAVDGGVFDYGDAGFYGTVSSVDSGSGTIAVTSSGP